MLVNTMESNDIEEIYIVFKKTTDCRLKFLKAGFGHILLFKYNEKKKCYVEFDPRISCININVFNYDMIKFNKDLGYKVLKVRYIKSDKRYIPRLSIISCVNMVKYYMNYSCLSLTPYSFYKHLKRGNFKHSRSNIIQVKEL